MQSESEIEAEDIEEAGSFNIDFRGKNVLLVDDNGMNREIATYILEDKGLTVETAIHGRDAVQKIYDKGPEHYDFVLMDIQMPVMNGYEATEIIRKLFPDSDLTIIALSANAFEEDKKKSIDAGMNAHVSKPINIDELMRTLAKFI